MGAKLELTTMTTKASQQRFEAELSAFPSDQLMQCPFPFYAWGRGQPPVRKVPGQAVYLVFCYDDITSVFRDTETYSVVFDHSQSSEFLEYGGATHLLGTDPPLHQAKRELASPSFGPARLKGETDKIRATVDALIDGLDWKSSVEFVQEFAYPLPAKVICGMLGLPSSGPNFTAIQKWSTELTRVASAEELDDASANVDRGTMAAVVDYVAEFVRHRDSDPADDLVSEILSRQREKEGRTDLALATTLALEMLAGGVITTGQLIANAMHQMVRDAALQRSLRQDTSQIRLFVEETLRIESPVQYRPRKALRDVEIGGIKIPAGSTLILMVGSANRDESMFAEAGEFQVRRPKQSAHLAFGNGAHFCMGAPLARLEARIAFEQLLGRFEWIVLENPDSAIENVEARLFRAPAALTIRLEPTSAELSVVIN